MATLPVTSPELHSITLSEVMRWARVVVAAFSIALDVGLLANASGGGVAGGRCGIVILAREEARATLLTLRYRMGWVLASFDGAAVINVITNQFFHLVLANESSCSNSNKVAATKALQIRLANTLFNGSDSNGLSGVEEVWDLDDDVEVCTNIDRAATVGEGVNLTRVEWLRDSLDSCGSKGKQDCKGR